MLRLICSLLIATLAQAATPIYQSSFEKPAQGWTVVRGSATLDSAVTHESHKSIRLERDSGSASLDACVRLAPIALTLGKRYELSGWVRTEGLEVRDVDRSPIASGATLTMASMPFDVHSASLGGTQPWTRLTLRFVASRAEDQILLDRGQWRLVPAAKLGSKACSWRRSLRGASGRRAMPLRLSARRIAIPPQAGFICTSKASRTNADTNMAI